MKILIVNNNFNLKTGGGAERYVFDIVEGLKSRGHTVFTSTGAEHLEEAEVVYVNNCFNTSLLKVLTKKPAVRFIHDHQIYCPGTPKYWFNSQKQCSVNTSLKCIYYGFTEKCQSRNPAKFLPQTLGKKSELAVNRRFAKIFVASNFMRSMLLQNGFQEDRVEVNHLFPYKEVGDKFSIEMKNPLILYVGRIFKEKGVFELIQAVSLLKSDFQLVICGTGWDENRCKNLVKTLDIENRVVFKGFVSKRDLFKFYNEARVVVVPSVWSEPFGLVGIEAYQYKKPVVAFDSGGISEWLKDGKNGFLVERLNVEQMAQKIDLLLKDKNLALKMGRAGKVMVEKEFSLESHLNKLEQTLEEIIV